MLLVAYRKFMLWRQHTSTCVRRQVIVPIGKFDCGGSDLFGTECRMAEKRFNAKAKTSYGTKPLKHRGQRGSRGGCYLP